LAGEEGYLLDNQQVEAGARFEALSRLFNPGTFRHIEALGLRSGWRCWEIGAGGPSVPEWLATKVGDGGHVLATDLDTDWLRQREDFEIQRHDIGVDPAPADGFDLVHARLVLVHVRAREQAIATMAAALRPGGWLLVEEADPELQPLACPDRHSPAQRLANRLKNGFRALMINRGVDLAFGRTLPRLLRSRGLVDVQADAFFPLTGPACAVLERATVEQIGDRLVAAGLATAAEIDEHLANLATDQLDVATSPLISAWGRKPADDQATDLPCKHAE
jgi:SAM-dependent methyltransferase